MAELDYDYIAKLVKKTQVGDSDAFAELYTATYKKQYRFTYQYVKDSYLAQDILQDVYILVLKNINTLKNPRLFVSWLNQINFRVCFDTFKRQRVHAQELDHGDELLGTSMRASSTGNPEQQAERHAEQVELMSQILSLHPKEAQAIIMKYYNDMTVEDIADAMSCSRSTVKRRLLSGRKNLETLLRGGKGGMSHEK